MIQFKTTKGNFLAVKVPKEKSTNGIELMDRQTLKCLFTSFSLDGWGFSGLHFLELPVQCTSIILDTSTVTEEQIIKVIDDASGDRYKDYRNGEFLYSSAFISLRTLFQKIDSLANDTEKVIILKIEE